MKKILKNIYLKTQTILSDEMCYKLLYFAKLREIPNKNNPKYLSEKIHCIKLSKWLEDKQRYVDKYKVREYISNVIGEKYLIKLLGVYNSFEEINFSKLPNSFVLKLNNGSGCNIIVKDKEKLDYKKLKKELDSWMKSDYYKLSREKQYKNIKQYILCEEYLSDDSGELRDYKFFCFNGKVEFVQVDNGRFSTHIQNFYDRKWNKLDITYMCDKNNIFDTKPDKYYEMLKLAEKLACKFPFVRVDLYYTNNKIYFGELTFTPNNGMGRIKPIEKDIEFASLIDLNQYK